MQIAFVLGLLVATIVLFAWERLPVDLTTLLVLVALVVSGILSVFDVSGCSVILSASASKACSAIDIWCRRGSMSC